MVRESRLLLEVVVGPRTEESATKLVEGAAGRLAEGCWPLWSSDGWEPYVSTLTVIFAVLIHFIVGAPQRDHSAACRAAAPQNSEFRQTSNGARDTSAVVQELLQSLSGARHVEGEGAGASSRPD